MITILIFFVGLIIGSFLNVVICRLPDNASVACPESHCPRCRHPLAWNELIPLFSYIWQRGKCRHCGQAISTQYPLVELATGVSYLMLFQLFGLQPQLLAALLFVSLCIPISIIDLRHQIIPDQLNLFGAILGLLVIPVLHAPWLDMLAGGFLGWAVMLIIALVSRGGMGGGDIKMMAWMGLFLGWKMTLLALFLSFVIGGLVSLILIVGGIKKRKDYIPFGPFLALGGCAAFLFGREILKWYIKANFT